MLSKFNISPVLAVKDIKKAKEFYEGKLGFKADGDDPDGIYYKSGNTRFLVYESRYAGTNKATAAGWKVKDIKSVVADLKQKGVKFEHYDMPDVKHDGEIHIFGPFKAAWFTDPDGNILAIDEMG